MDAQTHDTLLSVPFDHQMTEELEHLYYASQHVPAPMVVFMFVVLGIFIATLVVLFALSFRDTEDTRHHTHNSVPIGALLIMTSMGAGVLSFYGVSQLTNEDIYTQDQKDSVVSRYAAQHSGYLREQGQQWAKKNNVTWDCNYALNSTDYLCGAKYMTGTSVFGEHNGQKVRVFTEVKSVGMDMVYTISSEHYDTNEKKQIVD